jgi:hypothetical protein
VSLAPTTAVSKLLLLLQQQSGLVCMEHFPVFLLRGLPSVFSSAEILRRSSSSLPPYFVTGHHAAFFSVSRQHKIA